MRNPASSSFHRNCEISQSSSSFLSRMRHSHNAYCFGTVLAQVVVLLVHILDRRMVSAVVMKNNNNNNNKNQSPLPLPPAKLLVRRIRSPSAATTVSPSTDNVTHVVDVLTQLMEGIPENDTISASSRSSFCSSYASVVVEALANFGKAKRPDLVLDWYYRWGNATTTTRSQHEALVDETVRTMAISALGCCGRHVDAVALLPNLNEGRDVRSFRNADGSGRSSSMAGSYNAAIAACKGAQDWELAMDIFERRIVPQQHSDMISTITVNALMSVLLASRQGNIALDLLNRLWLHEEEEGRTCGSGVIATQESPVDGVTLQLVTHALIRSDEIDHAYNLLCRISKLTQKERLAFKITSIEPIFDLLASAYDRRSNWKAVERVQQLRHRTKELGSLSRTTTNVAGQLYPQLRRRSFRHWDGLEKIKKGKDSFWVVGTYRPLNMTVGLHPNRNPAQNGIQMVFYINEQQKVDNHHGVDSKLHRKKIGYLLMKNSVVEKKEEEDGIERTSLLLGMFLEPNQRGKGLAKICLALWIWFSLKAGIEPCTGIIRKPLLSLALQKTFGFVPNGDGGVDVELSPDPRSATTTILYCPSGKCLEGTFSPWDLEKQNIRLVPAPPVVRGKIVRVGCRLSRPSDEAGLYRAVQTYVCHCDDDNQIVGIPDQLTWDCDLSRNDIQNLFLGM